MAPLNICIQCFHLVKEEIEEEKQCCGSGTVSGSRLYQDSIGYLDPNSNSQSGSRWTKMTQKNRKKFKNSIF
jgi:hypothetical protein